MLRVETTLLVASRCNSQVVQVIAYGLFQLMHMPRDDHAQSIESKLAMAAAQGQKKYCSTHNFASTVSFGI